MPPFPPTVQERYLHRRLFTYSQPPTIIEPFVFRYSRLKLFSQHPILAMTPYYQRRTTSPSTSNRHWQNYTIIRERPSSNTPRPAAAKISPSVICSKSIPTTGITLGSILCTPKEHLKGVVGRGSPYIAGFLLTNRERRFLAKNHILHVRATKFSAELFG